MAVADAAVADMFRVDQKRVRMLNPYEAVDLAARLIRADASASGIPSYVVDIPLNITAPNGGVNGTASDSPRQSARGLVKRGTTAYLFRTGAFSPGSSIARILFTRQGEVKPRIRSCIERGGTLVALLFGWEGTDRMDDDALSERFKMALASKSGALSGASVDVWGLARIVASIEQFPGLAASVSGGIPAGMPVMSHSRWSCVLDMKQPFRHGKAEDGAVERIRAHLRGGGDAPVHVRVSGPPGSGKSRLVLEATRAVDLAPRVVYADDASVAMSAIAAHSRRAGGAGGRRLILVADECNPSGQSDLRLALGGGGDAVADLVTIYSEPGADVRTALQVEAPDMSDEQIAEILEGYAGGGIDDIEEWVALCRPSPRAAHIVGRNLSDNPDDMFADPDAVLAWERYVAGWRELRGGEYRDRLAVLPWLGQFTEFGFDAPHKRDGERIAELVRRHHPEITPYRFREVVRTLRSMGVLRGGPVLHIEPRILHEYMWLKWWERYLPCDAPWLPPGNEGGEGDGANAHGEGTAGHLPALRSRYYSMLESMRGRKYAARAAGALFGKGGPLEEGAASGGGTG